LAGDAFDLTKATSLAVEEDRKKTTRVELAQPSNFTRSLRLSLRNLTLSRGGGGQMTKGWTGFPIPVHVIPIPMVDDSTFISLKLKEEVFFLPDFINVAWASEILS
jgi:hypothetical protein